MEGILTSYAIPPGRIDIYSRGKPQIHKVALKARYATLERSPR
jgi:hypothetical protein